MGTKIVTKTELLNISKCISQDDWLKSSFISSLNNTYNGITAYPEQYWSSKANKVALV